jgi:ubiquinone/menaquinone biosynthesis C-methylase UbiE
MSSLHQGFQATDQPADTEAVFGWLDRMNGSPLIQQVKRQMLEARPVGEGDHVLDVGCGLGHEVFRLAELVGPQGQVIGIDANSAMITEARRRASGLTLPIAFEVGDARHVDFPDNTFDLCRTERVLRYLDRPEAALGEMARLARPGGSVLAFDFDSDQTVVDAPDPALTRRIAKVLDAAVPHPWIGRQLSGCSGGSACMTCESSRTSSACRGRPGSPYTSNSTGERLTGPGKPARSPQRRWPLGGER